MPVAEAIICERCEQSGAEQCGLAFLCPTCVVALGLCEHCKRDDATVTLDDERLCDGCYDDAMTPEDYSGEDL